MKFGMNLACALLATVPALAELQVFTPLPTGSNATALNNLGQVSGEQLVSERMAVGPELYSNGTVRPLAMGV